MGQTMTQTKFSLKTLFVGLATLLLLTACQSVERRTTLATQIGERYGFQEVRYKTSTFTLYGQEKILKDSEISPLGKLQTMTGEEDTIHIYIEGDGLAWFRPGQRSGDPTPTDPIGLKLATQDEYPNVAYLARPCQYTCVEDGSRCYPLVWTDQRFSPHAVQATNEAITQLKQKYGFKRIVLFGYSGGGAIAVLVAAKRSDVAKLVTIAGNLNTGTWIRHFNLSPLEGSLDPMEFADQVKAIPQIHFVGEKDDVLPLFLYEGYMNALGHPSSAKVVIVKGQDHYSGWETRWKSLLRESVE